MMRLSRCVFPPLVAAIMAAPGLAQEIFFDPNHSMTCLRDLPENADLSSCFGVSAQICMVATPGGGLVSGETQCLVAEAEFWTGQMQNSLRLLAAIDASQDAQSGDTAPAQSQALEAMQASWLAYRDARCSYEAAQVEHEIERGAAYAYCVLNLTANHTAYIQNQTAN